LNDAPVLRSLLDSELSYGVKLTEEVEMLSGDGTGQHLHGIIPQAEAFVAPFTVALENRADIIKQALSQADAALLPSDGIVMNDTDTATATKNSAVLVEPIATRGS
jgi:HK97 family phage major capsid protein